MARRTKAETAPEVEEASELVIAEPVASDRSDEAISETTSNTEPSETRPSLGQPDRSSQTETIRPEHRRSIFLPLVAGGAIAALAGVGAGLYLAKTYPDALGIVSGTGLDQRLSDHDKRLTDLAAQVASLPAQTLDVTGLVGLKAETDAALAAAKTREDELTQRLQVLSDRLATLESAPVAAGGATAAQIAALTEEAQKKALEAQQEAEKVKAAAAAEAQLAATGAAVTAIQAAIETGAAFDAPLATLSGAGIAIPDTLASQSTGVPTLAALTSAYPDAARDALAISLAEVPGDGTWSRLSAFLRSQTGARSLTPRSGDDPDAVLSRAEAALRAGDLKAALAEIAKLPQAGQDRMSEWVGLAEKRVSAMEAVESLASELK